MNDSRLWTAREAARFLRISERHCSQLAIDGVIPSVKLGRSRRYRPQTLEAWLQAEEKKNAGAATPADDPTTPLTSIMEE